MELKRTTELFVEKKRRFVIRQPNSVGQVSCQICGSPMLAAEQVADLFNVGRREVYLGVEAAAVHFAEGEAGVVMVCLPSLAAVLDDQHGQLKGNI